MERTISNFASDMSAAKMVDAVINDAMAYSEEKTERDDDMTVMVVKIQ